MKKQDFFTELIEVCDLTSIEINGDLMLNNIEGYDSLAIMTMIAFIDDKFGVKLTGKEFEELTTLNSLVERIGKEKFLDA